MNNRENEEFEEADLEIQSRFASSSPHLTVESGAQLSRGLTGEVYLTEVVRLSEDVRLELRSLAYGGKIGNVAKVGSGRKFWADAGMLLARALIENTDRVVGRRVAEIGCGCTGLPGLVAAIAGAASIDFIDADTESCTDMVGII